MERSVETKSLCNLAKRRVKGSTSKLKKIYRQKCDESVILESTVGPVPKFFDSSVAALNIGQIVEQFCIHRHCNKMPKPAVGFIHIIAEINLEETTQANPDSQSKIYLSLEVSMLNMQKTF